MFFLPLIRVALDCDLSYSFLQAGSPSLFHFSSQRVASFIKASMPPFAAVFQVLGGVDEAGCSGQVMNIYGFIQWPKSVSLFVV